MTETPLIPSKGWSSHDAAIQSVGEIRSAVTLDELILLRALDLVGSTDPPVLTELGNRYFQAKLVRGDEVAALTILRDALLTLPPVIAVAQLLDGVAGRIRSSVETVLRGQGYGQGLKDRDSGFFVAHLESAGIIRYTKSSSAVEVLVHPARTEEPPPSVFISRSTATV
jgi:hypothetical protein